MIAVEKGLFKPEDEVSKYLPKFKDIEVAVLNDPKDKDISPLGVMGSVEKLGFSQSVGKFGLGSMMDTTLGTFRTSVS